MTAHLTLLLSLLIAVVQLSAAPVGPAGIYVISDTRDVPGEVDRYDWSLLSGFTLRMSWADLEIAPGVYEFSRIDRVVEEVRAKGKKLTLEIFVNQMPAHRMEQPGLVTWFNPHPRMMATQPVPWDPQALEAYEDLMQALADHEVAGTPWKLRDHPALESVDAPIVGLQGLRELSGNLVAHPDYERGLFIDAVVRSVRASREAFTDRFGFLALFGMDDAVAEPPLDRAVLQSLEERFNGPGLVSLAYFQETLSDTGPNPDAVGGLLQEASQHGAILFQALRPWAVPEGDPVPPENASGNPAVGFSRAWEMYDSAYVEIYGADLLHGSHTEAIAAWNRFFTLVQQNRRGELLPTIEWAAEPAFYLVDLPQSGAGVRGQWWRTSDFIEWKPVGEEMSVLQSLSVVPTNPGGEFYRLELLAPLVTP